MPRTADTEDHSNRRLCSSTAAQRQGKASISFIQVCRNYLRSYGASWTGLADQEFLKYLYKSGTAFYVFAGCSVIDLVASIRITEGNQDDTKTSYVPLLVSIKSHHYFSPGDAKAECIRMEAKASASGIETALCLLVLFGSTATSNDNELKLKIDDVSKLLNDKMLTRVLRILLNDEFHLSKAFLQLTSASQEMNEIFASHSFIRAHTAAKKNLQPGVALRQLSRKDEAPVQMLKELTRQLDHHQCDDKR